MQVVYDALEKPLEHPLNAETLKTATKQVISTWNNKRGVSVHLSGAELSDLIEDVDQHWSEAERDTFLKRLSQSYEPFRQQPTAETKKGKSKSKKQPVETES